MKILINYADDAYIKSQKWNSWSGEHIAGFDKVYSFSPTDIAKEYYKEHEDILREKRGNGLWLWKPYFINKVLNEVNDGDIVFYADSGSFFVKKIDSLILSLRDDEKIWVSDCPLLESCFTKPICFSKLECDESVINSNQIQATYLMLVCCDETREFVREWLHYCEDYELMSPEGSISLEYNKGTRFVAHREDQSILSLLCKKKGIKAHKDPSQRGKYPETFFNPYYRYQVPEHTEDKYGTVLFLHKAKALNVGVILRQFFITVRSKYRYNETRKSNI